MKSETLNAQKIRGLKPKKAKYYVWEKGFRNGSFGVCVLPTGVKKYVVDFRDFEGDQKRRNFADAYSIQLADARLQARELIALGQVIPPPPLQQPPYATTTFGDLAESYLTKHAIPRKRPKSVKEDKRILSKELLPLWDQRSVSEVSRNEVRVLLEEIAIVRRKPVMANRVKALISKIFEFGVERELAQSNPAAGIRPFSTNEPRDRVLTRDELRVLVPALYRSSSSTSKILLLVLLTGKRPGEVAGMRWSEITGDDWTIPGTRTKNGKSSTIRLNELALELLALQQTLRMDREDFVFSSRNGLSVSSINCGCNRLISKMSMKKFTPHDLRRTAATYLAELGAPNDAIKVILGHSSARSDVTKRYNRYDYRNEVVAVLAKWSDEIRSFRSGSACGDVPKEDDRAFATALDISACDMSSLAEPGAQQCLIALST